MAINQNKNTDKKINEIHKDWLEGKKQPWLKPQEPLSTKKYEHFRKEILGDFQIPNYQTKDLIGMFENGFIRYNQDATFHQCINALQSGENPIKIIDAVLKINSDLQEQLKDHIQKCGIKPITFNL